MRVRALSRWIVRGDRARAGLFVPLSLVLMSTITAAWRDARTSRYVVALPGTLDRSLLRSSWGVARGEGDMPAILRKALKALGISYYRISYED
jgi:hypothetical protein